MMRLEHWGCPWSREPDGHVAVRPFGGMKIERTWFAADKTGFHMLPHPLPDHAQVRRDPAIRRVVRHPAARGRRPVPGGRGHRARAPAGARHHRQGRRSSARAGAARSSPSPPTPPSRTATGWRWPIAPACRSRTWSSSSTIRPACPFTGILITEAARGEGGWLLEQGRLPLPAGLRPRHARRRSRCCARWSSGPRDRLSQASSRSRRRGAPFEGPYGDVRSPGRPAPGREGDRQEDPVRARAVPRSTRASIPSMS